MRSRGAAAAALLALSLGGAACSPSTGSQQGSLRTPSQPVTAVQTALRGPASIPVDRTPGGRYVDAASFGMHVLHGPQLWPTVPVGSERIWDDFTTWHDLEPARGTWNWSRLDQQVTTARSHHADVLLTLGMSPRWASSRPDEKALYGRGSAAPPSRLSDWATYVRSVATRYRGRIGAYEVWNEPNWRGMYHGSPQMLATLTRIAYRAVKSVDPSALVLSPSFVVEDKYDNVWMRAFFAAGAAQYIDAVAVHVYVPLTSPPERALGYVAGARQLMAAMGVHKPIWDTETTMGRRSVKTYSAAVGGGQLARDLLLAPAMGMVRTFWYGWDDYDFGGVVIRTKSGHVTSVASDYQRVRSWLLGAKERGCSHDAAVWSCTLQRGPEVTVAAWTTAGKATAAVPRGFHRLTTLSGASSRVSPGQLVTLTGRPLLLRP